MSIMLSIPLRMKGVATASTTKGIISSDTLRSSTGDTAVSTPYAMINAISVAGMIQMSSRGP